MGLAQNSSARRALVTRGTSVETPKRPYRLSAEQCRGRNALLARTMKKRNLLEFLCFDTNKIERGSQNKFSKPKINQTHVIFGYKQLVIILFWC